jgi:membrane protease YdiL (CAAX protease family)
VKRRKMSFTSRLALTLVAALAAAVIVAPFAGSVVAMLGYRIPFPRIFDRTAMATVLVALIWSGGRLRFIPLLAKGFRNPRLNWTRALKGLVVSLAIIVILGAAAVVLGGTASGSLGDAVARVPKYLLSAIVIAIIEEAFFRAFLLEGMRPEFRDRGALAISAVVYSVAHVVRSPAKFYATGFDATAGLVTLAHSFDQISHPATAVPVIIGLFLLGIVLGEAFLLTGTAYLSAGLHAGFVLGSKLWPKLIENRAAIPFWLGGVGPLPLIGGVAAWVMALALLALMPIISRPHSSAQT